MPNTNEVMNVEEDLDELLLGYKQDVTSVERKRERQMIGPNEATRRMDVYHKEALSRFKQLIAQQNAALLRSLLDQKVTLREVWGDGSGYDNIKAIPASILEAKLNELDTTKEVEI